MLRIIQSSILITLQDCGRTGYRRYGVPASGALDPLAHALANRVVGNPANHATLEITGAGAILQFEQMTVIALVGADLGATFDDRRLPTNMAWLVRAGHVLHFTQRNQGARVYLAVSGGFRIAPQLGSRSTLLGSMLREPLNRPLRAGDVLPFGTPNFAVAGQRLPTFEQNQTPPTIRYMRGHHQFSPADRRRFHATHWHISPTSNRMGYRLQGATLNPPTATLKSFGVVPGVIQVPPDGKPIVLLADAQTSGGYPIIGTVIQADLRIFAQLLPNDRLYFKEVTLNEAERAWHEQQKVLSLDFE